MSQRFNKFSDSLGIWMRKWSIPILRVSLGIVFLWFGVLKIFGVSPVAKIIGASYSFFPEPGFIIFLGIWETVIGLGLIFKFALRIILPLLWLQMAGTLCSLILAPSTFFIHGNLLLLTTEGEFVIKNIVLIAVSFVIGGHEVNKN